MNQDTQSAAAKIALNMVLLALASAAMASLYVVAPLDTATGALAQAPRTALSTRSGLAPGSTAAPAGQVRSFVAAPPGQPFVCRLQNEKGQEIFPSAVVRAGNQTFLLGPDCLYVAQTVLPRPETGGTLTVQTYPKPAFSQTPNTQGALTIPVHEFVNLLFCPFRQSLLVLDKSGDIFEFDLAKKSWSILRANLPGFGSPDPEYIDICLSPGKSKPLLPESSDLNSYNRLNLLDPERNQIWKLPLKRSGAIAPHVTKSFPEVMPWRVRRGSPSVAESIAITYDSAFYVLRNFGQSGQIAVISPVSENMVVQKRLGILGMHSIRPTRMVSFPGMHLFIVERENNRVLDVDKKTGSTRGFLFGASSDLRGISPDLLGFWIIDGSKLVYRRLSQPDAAASAAKLQTRTIDARLKRLHMPIMGMTLPRHAGVYPGARRLYRYGVHEGMDFFYGGGTAKIYMGSPVVAAGDGKVIRADANFKDMDRATYNRIMSECAREHRTTDKNEDLFRGCQVWIDHGDSMITRYAHLNKINPKLKVGQTIKHGDLVGFVGVSGTGQNLPGVAKYPHLHFEIWLDGKYLGYGLTPAETVGVFEGIFGGGS